jgi:protocatechuate 3,4-dioxygenase alpha subunit
MSETDVGEIGLPHERHEITPSQTVGPYFAFGLTPGTKYNFSTLAGSDLVTEDTVGEAIEIAGRVTDGEGAAIPDAMIELWQADGAGRLPGRDKGTNTTFKGFGRSETVNDGVFSFRTVKPGPLAGPDGRMQAPHINVGVFSRGVVRRMFTRIYFEDEAANGTDLVLALVPPERRATLIARRDGTGADGVPRYRFDVRVQGENETVFFEA